MQSNKYIFTNVAVLGLALLMLHAWQVPASAQIADTDLLIPSLASDGLQDSVDMMMYPPRVPPKPVGPKELPLGPHDSWNENCPAKPGTCTFSTGNVADMCKAHPECPTVLICNDTEHVTKKWQCPPKPQPPKTDPEPNPKKPHKKDGKKTPRKPKGTAGMSDYTY